MRTWPCFTSSEIVSTVASVAIYPSNVIEAPSHSRVMRPRNRLPFAINIVVCRSPRSNARNACGSHGIADAMWPCVGENPGSPCERTNGRSSSFVEVAAHDAEPREHPVVPVGDVAAARRLRDLRVVQLGGVAVDVGDRAPHRRERDADDVLRAAPAATRPPPRGGARPHPSA